MIINIVIRIIVSLFFVKIRVILFTFVYFGTHSTIRSEYFFNASFPGDIEKALVTRGVIKSKFADIFA